MSDQQDTQDIGALIARVQELTKEVHTFAARRRSRQRVTAIVGVILAITVSFSLGGLTNMTKRLDAEAIAQIGRQQLELRLPSARLKVQDYLEAEAPRIVNSTLRSMLATLPHVRGFLFKGLNAKLDELNFEFEKNTKELMAHLIQETKHDVDAAYPRMSDREKLEKLVETVATKFTSALSEATTGLYPRYRDEMSRIVSHLDNLEHSDPAKLTEEERIHKEIVVTLLHLLERRQSELTSPTPSK